MLVALFIVVLTACSDSPDELLPEPEPEPLPEIPEVTVSVSAPEHITVTRRHSSDVTLTFEVTGDESLQWTCTSSNPDVATAAPKDDTAVTVTGIAAGETTVTITATAGEVSATAEIAVTVDQGTVRILAIGNSFSQDAVEQYFYELAHAAGIEVVVGNLYIGGCDLDRHYENLQSDADAYEYRKVVAGRKTNRAKTRLSEAFADEPWDYVSLQQASGKSGQYNTYAVLPQVIGHITSTLPDATLIWHQTWAYASSSNHADFPAYGKNQMTMYNAIIDASRRAMTDNTAMKLIVPSGTAIQNARTTYVGDIFNRDGYHLEVTYGRYTAACTWFEAIFGIDVTTTAYAPSTVSDEMAAIARLSAHRAVTSPYTVTEITEYARPDVKDGYQSAPVYIDFGPNSVSAAPWNNYTSFGPSDTPVWLKDIDGNFVSTGINVTGGFTGSYLGVSGEDNHTAITAAGIEFPVTAWKDGLIVAGTKGDGDTAPGRLVITSLNPAGKYDLTLLAVRYNGSRDARISAYKVIGRAESEVKQIKPGLKIASSGSGVYPSFDRVPFEEYAVTYSSVEPDADGTITVEVTGIDTGIAAEGHLNALVIAPAR